MYQQANIYIHRYRYIFAGIVSIAFLMVLSAVVTSIGSNTILNSNSRSASNASDADASDGPDILTNGSYVIGDDLQQLLINTGTFLYSTCKSINNMTNDSSKVSVNAGAAIVNGAWSGTKFVGDAFGESTLYTFHTMSDMFLYTIHSPTTIVGYVTSGHAMSDIIQPTDETKSTPIISSETSAQALATLGAVQQQEIAKLQAAQLAANQQLDGAVVAGNPNHGGYPDRWNDAPQDSMLDSWGMYNRECVSYAAWKVYQTYGSMPYWGGEGNAIQWPGDAERAGIPVGTAPKVHSVAIWRVGYYGHAMWVEAVDGDMIYVSQYNYSLNGRYSEMWVNGSQFTYIYFH